VAERLRSALASAEISHAGHRIRITVSIGLAQVRTADTSSGEVVRRADRAVYAAKNAGRNQVVAK
jgi:diguanylate cyclase (GGDEF)-like protein